MVSKNDRRGKRKPNKPKNEKVTGEWSPGDWALYQRLLETSNLEFDVASETIARRAVEADRMARYLDSIDVRTGEENRALASAHAQYDKALASLEAKKPKPKKETRL